MNELFEQMLESKQQELRDLHEAYGGEFRADGLHIGEVVIGIAYTLSPTTSAYFYVGYDQAIFSKRFATATQAYLFAIRNAKALKNE